MCVTRPMMHINMNQAPILQLLSLEWPGTFLENYIQGGDDPNLIQIVHG